MGLVPMLYSGSCRLYSGSCRLYSGSCRLYQQQKWTTCPVKIAIFRGLGGGPRNLIFSGILLFLLLRNPWKNLKSYDNPFWKNIEGGGKKKKKKRKEEKKS